MKHIPSAVVWLVILALCLSPLFNRVDAQPTQERFQSINISLHTQQSARSLERILAFIVRCPKNDFGLRVSGKVQRPPRDLTATRFAIGISIKPFLKPKTHRL